MSATEEGMMNLFETLTGAENTELYRRLHRAGRAYDKLTSLMVGAPLFPVYTAAWQEVTGLLRDLNEARPAFAPPVFGTFVWTATDPGCICWQSESDYCPVHNNRIVPTGTGWPVT